MNDTMHPLSVAIVEDDSGLRRSLEMMVHSMAGMNCAGSYPSAEEALEGLAQHEAAVVSDGH